MHSHVSRYRRPWQYGLTLLFALTAACGPGSGTDASGDRAGGVAAGSAPTVLAGIDVLVRDGAGPLAGLRVGLITNHTGVTADGRSTVDVLHEHPDLDLVALFGPEHGIRGTAEAGVAIDSGVDAGTGLPVHSLYGETRVPGPGLLEGLDALAFDIQDIGARYYTYVWTMALSMRAAAEAGRRFVVLDRPNPIGGDLVQGNVLDAAFATFVGLYPVPMRHGLTAGELARLINAEFEIGADLHVVPVDGWRRSDWFDATRLPWLAPSPNMPHLESAAHYPGTCLFEGTNLSVGRGTDRPFQQIGAPWLDAAALVQTLGGGSPGVRIDTVSFTPTTPGDGKHGGVVVRGVRFTVVDRASYDPTQTAIATLAAIRRLHADQLTFRESHFDRLAGTDAVRRGILEGRSAEEITAPWAAQLAAFRIARDRYLLY